MVNNILYSQNIRHKIIPPACNNVNAKAYREKDAVLNAPIPLEHGRVKLRRVTMQTTF